MPKPITEVHIVLRSFAEVRREGIFKLDAIDEVARRTGIKREDVITILDASGVYELKEGSTIGQDTLFDTRYRP